MKQYQVNVDPTSLLGHGVTMDDVVRAVRASNQEVGGRVIEMGGHEQIIRGRGYVKIPDDIGQSAGEGRRRHARSGCKDVATVSIGPDIRRGSTELNGKGEAPGGIVVMRYGENALTVIDAVKQRLRRDRPELAGRRAHRPDLRPLAAHRGRRRTRSGTRLHRGDDRRQRRSSSSSSCTRAARSSPSLTLPIGVLLAFIPMAEQHLTANIMSLGGIAVAIGAMVDASIIIIENIHKQLARVGAPERRPGRDATVIVHAMQEVGPSIFFSLLVITVSFLPVFTLEATEGRLFKPLAFTKTYSIGFASVLAVTLTPALAVLLIRGKVHAEDAQPDQPRSRGGLRAGRPLRRRPPARR